MEYKLPPLPEHPEPRVMAWSELEKRAIQEYGEACAIAALEQQRQIEAQGVPDGWQPIETAPKDVTLLLYGAKRLEMCVGINHSRDGWVTDTTSEWASMYPPTHWMPLPSPPTTAEPGSQSGS